MNLNDSQGKQMSNQELCLENSYLKKKVWNQGQNLKSMVDLDSDSVSIPQFFKLIAFQRHGNKNHYLRTLKIAEIWKILKNSQLKP